MNWLWYLAGVLLFLLGVGISIGLHELGHMIPAKKFGVKVTQYFVGFGPTIWSRKHGETEYGIKALPLGGYVKLVGMIPPGDPSVPKKNNRLANLIAMAREVEYAQIKPEDEPRLFYKKPWWQKLIVMAGGPAVNLVLAVIFFGAVNYFYGVPGSANNEIATVSKCIKPPG